MGILDTLKVRKNSYPIRRVYKLFYRRYEDLHPIYAEKSFERLEAEGADFKVLSKE